MCTSWRFIHVLVAQSFFTSTRLFLSMHRSTCRRHYMHQHLQPLSSSPFAPVDLQAFPDVESFPPPLAPHPSPGACIVPLVTDSLKQLSSGLIITPATISSPAAVSRVVRIANSANYEAPKSGDSRRIVRRSIKSLIA